jgi:hypothetical protein
MRTLLFALAVLMLSACQREKPFIIVHKHKASTQYEYLYQCASGPEGCFYEDTDKYNIGDTLR